MKFMVMVKATKDSEAGVMPTEQDFAAMGKFNEELVKAGVMLSGEGLKPSSNGARVRFSGKDRQVIDGPFAETKELVAGFWLWECKSLQEAIEWVKRCPNPMPGDSEIEIRPLYGAEDFGEALTPELREQEERLRKQVEAQKR
ncbi:YciI family protein [Caenimonas aquaedulcis]|uniref:YciI family protein n=1 Tax=Caenimonas aquaedulcis TaxID=2793270 RepID=A0A931H8E4_9BURK|nr:YciI family protein [Caenimonas aquaedulcis]MBG9390292.1 YciI family protein [Caenimonas aquaedulcis]